MLAKSFEKKLQLTPLKNQIDFGRSKGAEN